MLDNELDELLGDVPAEPLHSDKNSHKRKSLGRGLEALLGGGIDDEIPASSPNNSEGNRDSSIDINSLVPGKYQPRTEFEPEALQSLADSIKEKGVLQPLLVRRQGDRYEIIAGERRWRAAKLAGLSNVPVIIKDLSDQEVLEAALVENILRENLSAIEEAEGYQRLINEFSHTQEALSQIVGKSRSHIANTLRLLNLPQEIQNMVKEGKLSAGHARALVGLDNAVELAKQVIAKDLNVRQVEDLVAKQKEPKKEKTATKKDQDLTDIENDLNKELGLRIKITPSKQGGGKVVLQYASPAELDMILDILDKSKKNMKNQGQNTVFKSEAEPQNNEKFVIKVVD